MALSHQEPDRCPMDISFAPEFATRLKKHMNLGDEQGDTTYLLEIALDQDLIYTSVGFAKSRYSAIALCGDGQTFADEWGVRYGLVEYATRFGKGQYIEVIGHPLADDRAIDSYSTPDPSRPELYAGAAKAIREFKEDYWIVGGVPLTIFETAWALRGLERTLLDLVASPEFIERLFDIPLNYHLTMAMKLVAMGVDMIRLADDVGAQDRMLMSPKAWRRFLKPRMAEFVSELRSVNPGITIAYHSDGAIYPIISDLIEVGVDVLNPVQPACMDPERLKKEYGDRLCFWGTLDVQSTLPFGTPSEVEQEVLTRLRTVGRKGGLIIGPTHFVQVDTPLENFLAMVDTITQTPYSRLLPPVA